MTKRARAIIEGGAQYPDIRGEIYFTQIGYYVEVVVRIYHLPTFSRQSGMEIGPFAFHIHDGDSCGKGVSDEPFPNVGETYNPHNQPYGNNAGVFPVLMPLKDGAVVMRFLTDKFILKDVIGLPVVIHISPDDYRTAPYGNAGAPIACGMISAF